jgi:hypothetical protein
MDAVPEEVKADPHRTVDPDEGEPGGTGDGVAD